jgi:tRNA A-37 threonylcarbamoyl transferase component Bud32
VANHEKRLDGAQPQPIGDMHRTLSDAADREESQGASLPFDDRAGLELPIVALESYGILGEHARGGLGRIFKAHDRRLNRAVALKELLRRGPEAYRRFTREVDITARLQHPSIVPIHEAGRWPTGEPFYAMKFVSGRSLKEVIDETHSVAERIALVPHVIAVAEAIAYAHSEHIIHRDLKPSNVMIGGFGETVVIDWGLAKNVGEPAHDVPVGPYCVATDGQTSAGTIVGTPAYMPPEQARGEAVDERADVYALGSILYHVLAGVPPLFGNTSAEVVAKVIAGAPAALEGDVPAELVAIVTKAMARDATARYPKAEHLAQDLRRFQAGQLVSARRYSVWQLARRWLAVHRLPVALAGGFTIALVALTIVGVTRIVSERNRARAQEGIARAERDRLVLVHAEKALATDPTAALAWLKRYPPSAATAAITNVAADALSRGVATHVLRGHDAFVRYVDLSPDGEEIVSSGDEGRIVVWRVATGDRVASTPGARTTYPVFAPDGRSIAFGEDDGTVVLWSPRSGERRRLRGHRNVVYGVSFSPDGKWLATSGEDRSVRVWELAFRRELGGSAAHGCGSERRLRAGRPKRRVGQRRCDGTVVGRRDEILAHAARAHRRGLCARVESRRTLTGFGRGRPHDPCLGRGLGSERGPHGPRGQGLRPALRVWNDADIGQPR